VGNFGVDIKQTKNQIGCSGAGHAALGCDAELGDVAGGRRDPALRGLGTVTRDDAKIELGLWRQRKLT
jgi:hypothetical protein